MANWIKELTIVAASLGALLIPVQAMAPSIPQGFVDRLAYHVDAYWPMPGRTASESAGAEKSVAAEFKELGIPFEEGKAAETAQGGVETNFFPAFQSGYVYYEVSRVGTTTDQGRLSLVGANGPMPDFAGLKKYQVLRAEGFVRVRVDPSASTRKVDTVRTGECVQLAQNAKTENAVKTVKARSGGWLLVDHVECPS